MNGISYANQREKSRVLKIVMVNVRICILAIFIIKIQEVAMMNEEEKIKNVLDKYNKYFADTNSDVCHSIKEVWFFYQYDSKNDIYECFYQFSTAEELERIIMGEILEAVNVAIECTAEEIVFSNNKRLKMLDVDKISANYDFMDRLKELAVIIEAVHRTIHLTDEAYKVIKNILK